MADTDPPIADTDPPIKGILTETVFARGEYVAFGELTLEDVRGRADELKAAVGFGPTARVAPVARAWRELVMAMEGAGVGIVKELDADTLAGISPRLWVVPPGGSFL